MNRLLCAFILLLSTAFPIQAWAASFTAIASSAFTGADENPISESGVWTNGTEGAWKRLTNAAHNASTAVDSVAFYSGATFADNQYSRGKISTDGSGGLGRGPGLCVRRSAAGTITQYEFIIDHKAAANNARLARRVAGVYADLDDWIQAFTDGDQFTFAVEGSGASITLRVYDKTGVLVRTFIDTAGTGPSSGKPGLAYSASEGTTAATLVDDWEGGNFSTSKGSPIIFP